MGYEGVAINNSLPTLLDPPTGKKKKDQNKVSFVKISFSYPISLVILGG